MFYTPKIQKAIKFANKVHQVDQDQRRKGKKDPYIIHPLAVGLILSQTGATEDIIVAGILHDTIEDCMPWGSITKEVIEKEFNSEIARMVNDVTEQDKSLSWKERKKAAFDHIKHMDKDSIMVKSADVLQNLNDQIVDYEELGEEMFKRFNASKEKQLKRYQNLLIELEKAYPENPLLQELRAAVGKITVLWK